jgi:hypothetical protein
LTLSEIVAAMRKRRISGSRGVYGGSPARLVFIDETCTTTNIGSEAAGNFCIWQRGCRRSGRISLAWSQTYPTRPVHWIVSFSECGQTTSLLGLTGKLVRKIGSTIHQSMVRQS